MRYSINDFIYHLNDQHSKFTLSIPSFYIHPGEVVFVYGGSGSGKSTFFNLLAGIKESELKEYTRIIFNRIEYVMHESKLLPWHQLRDNIKVINQLNGKIECRNLIEYCKKMNLDENILKMKSWQLSQGMRQRFEIAISLSNQPDLIIFDEAMSGVDNANKIQVSNVVYEYVKTNNTALLSTAHQISDVLRLAERVVFIQNGVISSHDISIKSYSVEERLKMSVKELLALPEAEYIINAVL